MYSLFDLPDEVFVRKTAIIGTREWPGPLPVSHSNFHARIADGRFPKPYKLSKNMSAWKIGEVRAALAAFTKEG